MIRFTPALALIALVANAPALAQAARDFQLPPAPTPTPESRVQGPVDPDAPVPVRPRVIETARPATATPTPTPRIVLPEPSPASPLRTRPTSAAGERLQQRPTASPGEATATPASPVPARPEPVAGGTLAPAPVGERSASLPTPAPASVGTTAAEGGHSGPAGWSAILVALATLIAGAALVFRIRRRRGTRQAVAFVAPVVPAAAPGEALAITVEAVRLDRSVLNATVGYRVTVRNRTTQALSGVAVEADLVSASRERPAEQQLASPGQALAPRHAADRLGPGQSLRFEGQVRLPLSEASVIRQGRIGLLVPLLRVRATAGGALPVATTLVIGRAEGQAARPQPFRLDEPPRSYTPLAQRVLDATPARA